MSAHRRTFSTLGQLTAERLQQMFENLRKVPRIGDGTRCQTAASSKFKVIETGQQSIIPKSPNSTRSQQDLPKVN